MPTKSRLFNIVWNCAKMPSLAHGERMETRRAEGTQYTNGRIGLDTGLTFESIGEMTDTLRSYGAMSIVYQDEGASEDPTLDDVSNEPSRIPDRTKRFRLIKNGQ